MTTAIKRRRGTTVQHSTFTGLEGELTVDTTKDTVVVHDGATAGGFALLREDLSNNTNVASTATAQTFTNKTINLSSNTLTGTTAQFNTALSDGDFATLAGTETLSNKTFSTNPTISSGTANGVAYLNGSKVLTSGSALTFNGSDLLALSSAAAYTTLSINGATGGQISFGNAGAYHSYIYSNSSSLNYFTDTAIPHIWSISSAEQMRLTSTGLGIGTSSFSTWKLNVANSTQYVTNFYQSGGTAHGSKNAVIAFYDGTYYNSAGYWADSHSWGVNGGGTTGMILNPSGNLGLGVTPSAWSGVKAYEVFSKGNAFASSGTSQSLITTNAYYDGSFKYGSTAAASYYSQNSGVHAWFNAPSGTAGNAITFTQAMTLDASGKLGIGTPSPAYGIDLVGGGGMKVRSSAVYNGAFIEGGSGSVYFGTLSSDNIIFYQNTERMRIDSSGNLLVGTTTNYAKFVSNGGSGGAGTFINNSSTNQETVGILQQNSGSGYFLKFYGASFSTVVGSVYYSGSTTSYNTSSDYRLKENIQPMQGALDVVSQLNPVTYTWKADGSDGQGFIAHELQAVVPDCVTGEKDAVDAEGKPVYQGIDTSFLTATLSKAIQELHEIVKGQAAEIAELKAKIA